MDRHSTADGGTQHDCKSSGAPLESEISPWMCCWACDRELPEGSRRPQVFKSSSQTLLGMLGHALWAKPRAVRGGGQA